MSDKLRVLLVGESSFLSTGFARHGYEVLSRLHATNLFEVAELGVYGDRNDPRISTLPWRYYSNAPDEKDMEEFQSCQDYIFGGWAFDDVCLDFRPNVVMDFRDPWHIFHEVSSPARPFFHHLVAPTVDSSPQDESFIATFMQADSVFTFGEFGKEVLEQQSGGRIKWRGFIPHAPDTDIFRPLDKKHCRKMLGLEPDDLITLMVGRNQKRKLYDDLIVSFKLYLDRCPAEMARRSKLHLHTQAVDMAWNLPRLINDVGVNNHVVMTYACQDCGRVFVAPYQDPQVACIQCGSLRAINPGINCGIDRESMAVIYNAADNHTLVSICEGFGTPQVEASACGVKIFSVDYSAMRDVVRDVLGTPIRVQRMYREAETHAYRAMPDNEHLAELLYNWLSQPESIRASWVPRIREATLKHYSADRTAQVLIDFLSTLKPDARWAAPPRFVSPQQVPKTLPPHEYVKAGLAHIAGRPDLIDTHMSMRMSRDMSRNKTTPATGPHFFNDMSAIMSFPQYRTYDVHDAERDLLMMCENHNNFEKKRTATR